MRNLPKAQIYLLVLSIVLLGLGFTLEIKGKDGNSLLGAICVLIGSVLCVIFGAISLVRHSRMKKTVISPPS